MAPRFFAPGAAQSGDITDLPADEAAHLARVLRLKAGSPVRVFNGRGEEFEATVESIGRTHVSVVVGPPRDTAPEPRVAVTVAHAILKGAEMDEVVRDAVMMGVAAVQPMVTGRSEVTLATVNRGRRRERWERIAISAAKQSGRATVPAVLDPLSFDDVVHRLGHLALPGPGLMFVEPAAAATILPLNDLGTPRPRETTLVIGPEGGWEPAELERASSACRFVTLGGRTLRADAMAIVAIAALFALWEEY